MPHSPPSRADRCVCLRVARGDVGSPSADAMQSCPEFDRSNSYNVVRMQRVSSAGALHGLRANVSAAGAAPRSPRAARPRPLAKSTGAKQMAPRTHRGEQKKGRMQSKWCIAQGASDHPASDAGKLHVVRCAAGVTAPPSSAAKRLPRPPRSPTPTPSTPRARSTAGRSAGRPSPPTCSRAPAGRRARRACRCARRRPC